MKHMGTAAAFKRHFSSAALGEIFRSPIAGQGLRALTDIAKGQVIGLYGGRRFASLHEWMASGANDGRYLFSLGNGSVIDGKRSRLGKVNHSCEPNLTVVPVVLGQQAEMLFLAQRDIAAGEEFTLDYHLSVPDGEPLDLSQWRCQCSTPSCRGWMYAPDRLRRALRHAGKETRPDAH